MTEERAAEEDLLRRLRLCASEEERRRLLEVLLLPYLDQIARWALRISADRDEAAEIAQDALLAICSHVDRFRGECRFSTWVYTIVRNQGWKRAVRWSRDQEVPLEEAPDRASETAGTEEIYERREDLARFRRLLDTELTPLEAQIFLQHFGDGVPLAVLERELGLTNRSGAKAYLVAALRKLRRRMRSWKGGAPSPGRLAARRCADVTRGDDD